MPPAVSDDVPVTVNAPVCVIAPLAPTPALNELAVNDPPILP